MITVSETIAWQCTGAPSVTAVESVECGAGHTHHEPLPALVVVTPELLGEETRGGELRRIYVIWNRGYRPQSVIAESPQEALALSMASGHFKRQANYRKFLDCTDEYLAREDLPGLADVLKGDRSGVADFRDGAWIIGGEPFAS